MNASDGTSLHDGTLDHERESVLASGRAWLSRLYRFGWLLPVLLTLPALVPLLRAGFFVSDDGLFHVYRIAALADAWQHGVLYPRLFPQFGFGYGQAVLNFYAPLSYAPAALLAVLGASPAAAAEWSVALGFLFAALAAYGMGKYLWGTAGGVLAAVVYTYFPYHLADAYLRGALPEHMAFVFPPLIVWATVAAFREEQPVPSYLWGGLAWAGLAYTHNLSLLLMIPVWVALVLVLAIRSGKWNRFWGAAGGVALAVGLSAWLWLPFLAESKAVGLSLGPSEGALQHLAPLSQLVQAWPIYRYRAAHGAGLAEHPLGWPAVLLLVVVTGWLAWSLVRHRKAPGAGLALFGLSLALAAAVMTSALARPVWSALLPLLGQLQYPWRFMTLVALGLAIAAGALLSLDQGRAPGARRARRGAGYVFAGLAALVGLAFMVSGLLNVPAEPLQVTAAEAWSPGRMWAGDAAAGQVGATWTGEFLPQAVKEQRWALGRPLEGAQDGEPLTPAPQVAVDQVGYDRLSVRFEANAPGEVRLHQFYLPAWRAWVDGKAQEVYPSGELGLVTVRVPAAASGVGFRFGPSQAVMAAGIIVLLAAIGWGLAAWGYRWRARRRDFIGLTVAAPLLVLAALIVGANSAGLGVRTWTPAPVRSTVGGFAQLIGYDVAPAKGERGLDVTLYWFGLRETASNYKAFVHMLGPDGHVLEQHDGDPVGGFTPTTRWKQGEMIADTHRLPLGDSVAPGEYELRAGMYEVRPGETPGFRNLDPAPATADGRVVLGRVTVGN